MLSVLFFLIIGLTLGYVLRNKSFVRYADYGIRISVLSLLTVLGVSVGADKVVLQNILQIGIKAMLIAALGIVGSLAASYVYSHCVCKTEKQSLAKNKAQIESTAHAVGDNQKIGIKEKCFKFFLSGNLLIAICFVLGFLAGTTFQANLSSKVSEGILFLLIFLVGLVLGAGNCVKELLSSFTLKMLLLPLFTIVGTLSFTMIAYLVCSDLSLSDSLVLGSGLGYYSLSSVIISQLKSGCGNATQLATIALTTNVVREITAILGCSFFYKTFGKFAPISVAGVTSMDVCLPVIIKKGGGTSVVPFAVLHGLVLEAGVPLLVSFFCLH